MKTGKERTHLTYYKLCAFLPQGEEHAIPAEVLAKKLEISPRNMREEITRLRQEGHLILSSTGANAGYFTPLRESEIRKFVKEQRTRALTTLTNIKAAQEWLKEREKLRNGESISQMTIDQFMDIEE